MYKFNASSLGDEKLCDTLNDFMLEMQSSNVLCDLRYRGDYRVYVPIIQINFAQSNDFLRRVKNRLAELVTDRPLVFTDDLFPFGRFCEAACMPAVGHGASVVFMLSYGNIYYKASFDDIIEILCKAMYLSSEFSKRAGIAYVLHVMGVHNISYIHALEWRSVLQEVMSEQKTVTFESTDKKYSCIIDTTSLSNHLSSILESKVYLPPGRFISSSHTNYSRYDQSFIAWCKKNAPEAILDEAYKVLTDNLLELYNNSR